MRAFASSAIALCAIGAPAQTLEFADVSSDRGLVYAGTCGPGCAVAVGDFDQDGWEDLLLVGRGNGGLWLYHNQQGQFVNVSDTHLPDVRPRSGGALFCDLDGDGDQDLALARWHAGSASTSFFALENVNGRFERVDGLEPIGMAEGKLAGFTAGDLDGDGLPELVLLRPSSGTVVHNLGSMQFEDVTATSGLELERDGLLGNWSAVLARFSDAPRRDLHVAIDYGIDVHAHNLGDGTFEDRSTEVGTESVGNDMGVAVSDVDNDGDLDIFSTNIFAHTLYINDGTGIFNDEATPRGASDPVMDQSRWGYGCTFADLDLDGDEDLITMAAPGQGNILLNDGSGHFAPADYSGLDLQGYGLVTLDYDRDGDLDLVTTHSSVPPRLFERVGQPEANWLRLAFRGTATPGDGLGVRVIATCPDGAELHREVFTGDSFYSGRSNQVHLGLGSHTEASLRVQWPSGVSQTFEGIAAGQLRVVLEPAMRDGRPIGDVTGDCAVDLDDVMAVLMDFGLTNTSPTDVDRDADTDLSDLASVLGQFGTTCD